MKVDVISGPLALEAQSAQAETLAYERWERGRVEEARQIAAGAEIKPTADHVRVLVRWLDATAASTTDYF